MKKVLASTMILSLMLVGCSIGDNIGNTLPAFEMPCPIALLKPPYVVIFEIAKMKQIVMIGNHNRYNVYRSFKL